MKGESILCPCLLIYSQGPKVIPQHLKSNRPQCIFRFEVNLRRHSWSKIVSEYDQEIPQSQTSDKPIAP